MKIASFNSLKKGPRSYWRHFLLGLLLATAVSCSKDAVDPNPLPTTAACGDDPFGHRRLERHRDY